MALDVLNNSVKYIILAAALIGTIEAVVWLALSLVSILFYHSVIGVGELEANSYAGFIYDLYLNSEDANIIQYNINPKIFNIFMYLYLILSFIWLLSSCGMLWAVLREKWKNTQIMIKTVIVWSSVTGAIAIIDVSLMGLIAADLQKARDTYSSLAPESQLTILYTSMGIVMTTAARGYILWIVNIVFVIIMIGLVPKIKKADRPSMLSVIDAYSTGPRPYSLYEQTDIGNGHQNHAFSLDENAIFSPRQYPEHNADGNPMSNSSNISPSYESPKPVEVARPISQAFPAQSKLAKIGRGNGGRNTPPRNVSSPVVPKNMPFIPDPDYTPPGSPRSHPKSVLRPGSNYVL